MSAVPYLAGLRLAGRRVVVVGGGTVAQRRLPALLAGGAAVVVVSPEVTPAVEGMVGAGELAWERRRYAAGDLAGAWYAMALTDDPEVNAAVVAEAEAARVFCVRADDAPRGTAVTPASGEQDGVRVGVLTWGAADERDPRRAAAVRDGVLEALREGRLDSVPRRGAAPSAHPPSTGAVALVGGGPGDPDLITVRGRRLLAHADVVVVDRLAPRALLDELRPDVVVVDATKLPRGRAMQQEAITGVLLEHARAGRFVVRLKGGDPFVFGRGSEEMSDLLAAGVPVTVVPGVTSAVAVPGLAGIPLTHRGLAHEAVVVSGHVGPDDERSLVDWTALARLRGTLVILMGVDTLPRIAEVLQAHGRAPGTPVGIVMDGTMPTERVVVATLADVAKVAADAGVRPPAVVVVGEVVAVRESLTRPPAAAPEAPTV
jgi:uroporphyrin-III C-methyltransferase/precorrin-2 dehydrogenase/sirohydrochlorin ferrochelatase